MMLPLFADKSQSRRGFAIHAYVGSNGGGKTAAAVADSVATLRRGRPVLSTVRILDFDNARECEDPFCTYADHPQHGAAHPLWTPFTDFGQLLEFEGGDVLMDEVTGIAHSRESMGMPPEVANHLQQLRKRDTLLRWTSPGWSRADKIIRDCSQAVTFCSGHFKKERRGLDRVWRDSRLLAWRTYDAADFDEWSQHKRETHKPICVQLVWMPRSPIRLMYDTHAYVEKLGAVSDAGTCYVCGGHRRREACKCERPGTQRRPKVEDVPAPVHVERVRAW